MWTTRTARNAAWHTIDTAVRWHRRLPRDINPLLQAPCSYQGSWWVAFPVDGPRSRRADTSSLRRLSCFSNGEPRMSSDKLLINLFGVIISADGICAIVAAVIIVLVLARRQSQ